MKPNPRYRCNVTDLEHCVLITKLYAKDMGVANPQQVERYFTKSLDVYRKEHKRPPYSPESVEYRVWVIERNLYGLKHTVQAIKAKLI